MKNDFDSIVVASNAKDWIFANSWKRPWNYSKSFYLVSELVYSW